MQAVAATGFSLTGQTAECAEAGFASLNQAAKIGLQPQPITGESLFTKILTQAQKEKADTDIKADAISACKAEVSEDEMGSDHGAIISGLMARMFVMQATGLGDVSTTQTCARPEETMAVSIAPKSGEVCGSVFPAPQSTDDPVAAYAAAQSTDTPAAAYAAAQSTDAPEAVIAAPQSEGASTAAILVPQAAQAPRPILDGKDKLLKQVPTKGGGQVDAAVVGNNMTEKIVKALKSMGGDSEAGDSFGAFISDKKRPASVETGKPDFIVGSQSYGGIAADGEPPIDKGAAVEKAINQFISDFRSAEAGSTEIQIVLEPESLGTLTITVSRTENGISAKIKSDDREVCSIITDQIQKLIHSMENKGITVEDVEVVFDQMGQNQNFTQNSNSGGRDGSASGYAVRAEEKIEGSEDTARMDAWQGILGNGANEINGTVEYRV